MGSASTTVESALPDGLSVVVPTYERPERLARCLAALASADTSSLDVEVIVVDDGSAVAPTAAIEAVSDRIDVRLHSQDNAGPAAARNTGARLARYEYLAFTDDDCTPHERWPVEIHRAVRDDRDALVGGRTENAVDSVCSEASQDLVDALYRWQEAHDGPGFWTSNNLACSRRIFLDIGGFDETFPLPAGEDRELGARWQRSGRPLRLAAGATVDHHHSMSLAQFWRQHHNYGRGASRFREVLADDGEEVGVNPVGFYLSLVREPFRRRGPVRALVVATLIALSQVATVAGFVSERLRRS